MNESDKRRLDTFQFKDILNKTLKKTRIYVKTRRWKRIGDILREKEDNSCLTALTWKVGRPKTT